MNITEKYENWKNKLLDLGKRNRLLNYKETRSSTLEIVSPDCISLWNMFVADAKQLIFPYVNEFTQEENYAAEDSAVLPNVETNKTVVDSQKALRNLRSKARTAIEEQGVNVLYLSFGFVNWTDKGENRDVLRSPLVLVPVSLTVDSISSPFVLSLHEDEIVVNPTLAYKFSNDFGITLPEFSEEEPLESYFSSVEELISSNGWSLDENVSLSMLSFLKINMYNDLVKHRETILSHPIISAIAGDPAAVESIPDELVDYDFDKNEEPVDVFQVVDADASQQDAILLAKNGISFVLQGPPGTGKSQTITNIIAESLAAGKKVLFVSEKMAALEVVHRRLQAAGLDDFCLILHSHKANKRSVLNQLRKVLDFSREKHSLSDSAYQKLETLQLDKEKLNAYSEELYTPVAPLGKSIFEVNGIIANLTDVEDLIFSVDNIESISFDTYNRCLYNIGRLASSFGETTRGYLSNPWLKASPDMVSNELRHDVNSKLPVLINQLKAFDVSLNQLLEQVYISDIHSYKDALNTVNLLYVAAKARKTPVKWITLFDTDEIASLINELEGYQHESKELNKEVRELEKQINAIDSDIVSGINASSVEEEANAVASILDEGVFALWSNYENSYIEDALFGIKKAVDEVNAVKDELLKTYEPSVFEIDYNAVLGRFKTEYNTVFKIFKSQYSADKRAFLACKKEIVKKITDDEIISVISKLKQIDDIKTWFTENEKLLTQLFGDTVIDENTDANALLIQFELFAKLKEYKDALSRKGKLLYSFAQTEPEFENKLDFLYFGMNTRCEELKETLQWANNFKEKLSNIDAGDTFIEKACGEEGFAQICDNTKAVIVNEMNKFSECFDWFVSLFEDDEEFKAMSFDMLCIRLDSCKNNLSALEEWIDLKNNIFECCNLGLADFIEKVTDTDIPCDQVALIFKKRFFRLWLDKILVDYPSVLNFRRKTQDKTVSEFSELDKEQFNIAKARIRSNLINSLPSLDRLTAGTDELSILRRELKKQRRIMPIRKLFAAIPNLLLTLKPCLMMSPLSVSLFLEAETYQFDIVIFDEASQVCTENAIGAISRGKQVIIAGDSKQLPPTNFFQTAVSYSEFDSEDEEDYDDTAAYESILDEVNMLPERVLRWHYRSRNESLIAFSNARIYNNTLVTFPSNINNVPGFGVEYKYVPDGTYDRGGKRGNENEARVVVDLIFEHFRTNPERSLGVIAFGEVQQQAIDTELRRRRLMNPEFESFFNEEIEEPFFVKNLENVQGDERDTIIFSIGYAKDASGVFRMNFGPLSRNGGERRLNVAITRAKYNVKLVGSILPTDIIDSKISTEGPKLLKAYIEFAQQGQAALDTAKADENENAEQKAETFENSIHGFLEEHGYKTDVKIGSSVYKIDMAVKHPDVEGVYVLGIECDGDSYHTARTARERDRLRREVLMNMGWKLYRIWSTDWIKDPVTEGNMLLEAVENAISSFNPEEIFNEPEPEEDGGDTPQDEEEFSEEDYVNVERFEPSEEDSKNPYGFADATEEYSFFDLPRDEDGLLKITDCVMLVIEKEYPVHYDVICQRVAPLYGNEKVTSKIRNEVDFAIAELGREIVQKGGFFYPASYSDIPVRIPNSRTINHISVDEIAQAMKTIIKTCIGATPETICAEAARAFGFSRLGPNITAAMEEALELLLEMQFARILEGKVVPVKEDEKPALPYEEEEEQKTVKKLFYAFSEDEGRLVQFAEELEASYEGSIRSLDVYALADEYIASLSNGTQNEFTEEYSSGEFVLVIKDFTAIFGKSTSENLVFTILKERVEKELPTYLIADRCIDEGSALGAALRDLILGSAEFISLSEEE